MKPTRTLGAIGALVLALSACRRGPPPDFSPDPVLVEQIREIRMRPLLTRACPGESFRVDYEAVLEDGTVVPFATRYDRDAPPRLHVQFLQRTSPQTHSHGDGSWTADPDPWVSVLTGFELEATLRQRPALAAGVRIAPEYGCLDRRFSFPGDPGRSPGGRNPEGRNGEPGRDGPDLTVRLGVVRSPFVERLLVAAVEVEGEPVRYYLADAAGIAPRDWLVIETRGGPGGRGADGAPGQPGTPGTAGCPGGTGGAGGNGQNGGAGGPGGRGGRITIITASDDRFLAGIVDARNPGGEEGEGGKGGSGGLGGAGGPPQRPDCAAGAAGPNGRPGEPGQAGRRGVRGPDPQVITVPLRDVFGPRIPPELAELLRREE